MVIANIPNHSTILISFPSIGLMPDTDRISSNQKILYVEDEEVTRNTVIHLIKRRYPGATLLSAANGKEGLEMFRDERPDLVITDIVMPVMDGIRMVKGIKEISSDARIVVTSASTEPEQIIDAMKIESHQYLCKPINLQELFTAIDEGLR